MKYVLVAASLSLVALSSCAKPPSRIEAAALPSSIYANETCESLQVQKAESDRRLDDLTKTQNRAVMDDIAGVVLIGVPVSSLTGDAETALSIEKGKSEAIQKALAEKGCT